MINDNEKQEILNVVNAVYAKVKNRCSDNDAEISAACYSIQDFLGEINVDEDGVIA